MIDIRIAGLGKRFGGTRALDDVTLNIEAGRFVTVLGPSGCGKTTLLRLIAGFETPDRGTIHFGADLVADARRQVPPEGRGVGVVFQSYALWPHMSVGENVAYPLRTRGGMGKGETSGRVGAVLETVGLSGLADRGIEALSGGQRQRVALARCLVADARVILFDEPLANLDMHLRSSMAEAFRAVHARTGATMIYITHDQGEALALADRVVVMSAGRILQAATPEEVYRRPADAAVAGFVGRGSLLRGTILSREAGGVRVRIEDATLLAEAPAAAVAAGDGDRGRPVQVLVRPEALAFQAAGDGGLRTSVRSTIFRGSHYEITLESAGGQALSLDSVAALAPGGTAHVGICHAWLVPG